MTFDPIFFSHLNMSYNLLQEIPRSGFYGLDTLETLDLSFNDLRHVDASIFDNQKWLVDLKVRDQYHIAHAVVVKSQNRFFKRLVLTYMS